MCPAITSGSIAVLQGLNQGEGSVNSSSDVDGVGGRVLNCKHGIESEDQTDKLGEAQERSEQEFVGHVILNESGHGNRLGVVGGRWAG